MRRTEQLQRISQGFKVTPIVAMLGPRQCGKTTLAREYATSRKTPAENYFDLEDPVDLRRLDDPKTALEPLRGLIVIDEIQRKPELFPLLRVLIDTYKGKQTYLILGSASRELIQQSSESLAGRIYYLELTPFSYEETDQLEKLWLRGGFPLAFLAASDEVSYQWRQQYIRTFLEQDIPNLGIRVPTHNLSRFWYMLAHYNANIFNASEIGRSLALSYKTIQNYTDILVYTLMLRQLQPWYENMSKRQIKSPKIYFRDTGIYHALLGIETRTDLLRHPKLGASWENFALEAIIRHHQWRPDQCYFWATQSHAELDLFVLHNTKRIGFEFKYTDAPRYTKSMRVASEDLKLDQLIVIYPGQKDYSLAQSVRVFGLENYLKQERQL